MQVAFSLYRRNPEEGEPSMKSLFKTLKRRAKKALRRSETAPPTAPVRSPFQNEKNEPRSVAQMSDLSSTSKLSEQSDGTSGNALADLARRVSSSESNPIASSSSAALGLKSNIEQNWKLSSYKRSISEGAAHLYPSSEDPSEGFAFTVPRPITVPESEEPVSTLFKWGTIETTKSRQITPFDPPAKKQLVPFTHRSDSAIPDFCQEIGSFQLAKEILTLTQLRKHTKKGRGGTILDLHGTTIRGEGSLVITCPDTTIQNGSIELSEGVTVKAPGVAFIDVKLSSSFSHSAAISIVKKNCFLDRCKITNPEGTGIQITGMGSSLTMRRSTVFDCDRNCVLVCRGGSLKMNELCTIKGSRSFHGIYASDKETQITVVDSKIHDHCQDAVFLTQGVRAVLESCQVFGSRKYHGISGKKCGTNLILKNCQIHSNQESGIMIEQGAKAHLKECSIRESKDGHGIVVGSYGSHLELIDSDINQCNVGGILIFGSASGRIARTHIHDSRYGNGVVISGSGTSATLMNCVMFCNAKNNIYIENGGKVRLDDCDIFSSVRCNGVLIRDKNSNATLSKCNILKNQGCNVAADAGATCSLTDCRVDDAINGPNLLGRGRHTTIAAVALGSSANILKSSILAMRGSSVKLNEQKTRTRKSWNGIKMNSILNCKVIYPSI